MLQEKIEQCLPKRDPHERPDYTEAEAQALRAIYRGEASERQQRMGLDCLIRIYGTHDMSYRPENSHATAFAEGRRNAGTTLIWLLFDAPTNTDPDKISTRKVGDDPDDRPDNR